MSKTNNVLDPQDYHYWIHCNKCFKSYTDKRNRLFITACQHVVCETCIKLTKDVNTGICPICNQIVRMRQLGNDLAKNIKQLFHPMPWQEGLPTIQILRFQRKHRSHLLQHEKRKFTEYNNFRQSLIDARAKAKEQYSVLEKTREQRTSLEAQVRKVIKQCQLRKQEKAGSTISMPPLDRFSTRPRYNSVNFQQRSTYTDTNQSIASNAPRMIGPRSAAASFADFAYVDNSFTL